MISGVPEHVDGLMLDVVKASGASIINSDRMWHYPEGIQNYAPIWSRHGIRILSGPSPLWLDARGKRLPVPLFPGFDSLGALAQVMAIRAARQYLGDRLIRVAKPHRILDPAAGPLIAVKLSVLTRKSLGGLETDLSSRVLQPGGEPLPGVYAAGEVAGFGGGGIHGYRALEGTFLGGCIFSGRIAGRAAAAAVH